MRIKITYNPQSLFSFDFSREYGYIGFDVWRFCFFFRYRKSLAK